MEGGQGHGWGACRPADSKSTGVGSPREGSPDQTCRFRRSLWLLSGRQSLRQGNRSKNSGAPSKAAAVGRKDWANTDGGQ